MLIILALMISACQRQNNVCPPVQGTPQPKPALSDLITIPPPPPQSQPTTLEIGGKMVSVDKIVDYALCNDNWSGTVYVSCEVEVAEAEAGPEANPLFFKDCNLDIEPGTIVYVAAHNDAAYYKGCSCHTGADLLP
jgi:hypothetical protein